MSREDSAPCPHPEFQNGENTFSQISDNEYDEKPEPRKMISVTNEGVSSLHRRRYRPLPVTSGSEFPTIPTRP